MTEAFFLVGLVVLVMTLATIVANILERHQPLEEEPEPPAAPPVLDPFADHPMHCKCYHHR